MSRYRPAHKEQCMPFRSRRRWRAKPVLTVLVVSLAILEGSPLEADELPEDMVGIWVEGDCVTSERVRLINDLGVVDVLSIAGKTHLQILTFERITTAESGEGVESTLLSPSIRERLDQRFALKDGRLDGTFVKCREAPPWLTWTFGETVAAFQAFGEIKGTCAQARDLSCIEAVLDYVDVTGDERITVAEGVRVARAVGFALGYLAQQSPIVPLDSLFASIAIAGAIGPFVVKTIIEGSDYDGDGMLSLEEILQDRGGGAGLVALARDTTAGATQTAIQELQNALESTLDLLKSLPSPR